MKIPKIYPHRRDGQELRGREISQKSESFPESFMKIACVLRTIFIRRGVP